MFVVRSRPFPLLAFLVIAQTLPLQAQITSATLSGTATDATGALVPNAHVEARNLNTSLVRTADSDSHGGYLLSDLPAGHYEVHVTMKGFKRWVLPEIELQLSQHATVDAALQLGNLDQQVTVNAVAPLLNTVTSSVGQVLNTSTVERMIQGTTGNGRAIRASSVNVSINGTSQIWTGWSFDGANITELQLGGTLIQPNVDACNPGV